MRLFILFSLLMVSLSGQSIDPANLELKNATAGNTSYKGQAALKLSAKVEGDGLAVLKAVSFHNGTIEADVAGTVANGAAEAARGFIGISFRLQGNKQERFYVRPTNGRATDQLRRNHSTQYVSEPEWPWERLRKESPGVYESYTDMVPGEWIHLRIVVKGTEAELYVGGAQQPALLVHDLKMGDASGGVALWIGPGTEGFFRNLKISN